MVGFYISHGTHRRNNLDNLAVDLPNRRMGWATRMLAEWFVRAEGSGATSLTLQVNTGNAAAQERYRAHGFSIRRTLKGYYTNGDDAYEMEAALDRVVRRTGGLGRTAWAMAPVTGAEMRRSLQ